MIRLAITDAAREALSNQQLDGVVHAALKAIDAKKSWIPGESIHLAFSRRTVRFAMCLYNSADGMHALVGLPEEIPGGELALMPPE